MYDVLVAGGGPSGVIAAITVAKAGYSVILLDKKNRDNIGDKNCGDALDEKHVKQMEEWLGIEPPSIERGEAGDVIHKISIAAGGVSNAITATGSSGYIVNRLVYGQRLLKLAIETGVEILPSTTIVGLLVPDKHVEGVKVKNREKGTYEIRARLCIDATGYTAKLRNLLPSELSLGLDLSLPNKYTIATYREIIELEEAHDHQQEIVWLYTQGVELPGYLWIFTEGKNRLNIGITWDKSVPYPDGKSLKQLYHEYLDPYYSPDSYRVINKGGGNIPMRPNYASLVFNGLLLVGDAGCLVDPTTFEGHGPALESGYSAGKACVSALKNGRYSYRELWEHNTHIHRYLGLIHGQSFLAQKLLQRIGVDNIRFLINRQVLSEEDLISMFHEEGEVSTFSKIFKFFRAFPRWRMLIRVVRYVLKIEQMETLYCQYPENPDDLQDWLSKREEYFKL